MSYLMKRDQKTKIDHLTKIRTKSRGSSTGIYTSVEQCKNLEAPEIQRTYGAIDNNEVEDRATLRIKISAGLVEVAESFASSGPEAKREGH